MEFTVDGRKVFAATGGRPFDPGLPTIVFIHGAGMDHTVWALQARYFAHHGRNVLAVDLPGHGRSDGPGLASVAEMADWIIGLLDAAEVSEAALAGHSMGALAALDCAGRSPKRVRALALLGVAPKMPVHPDLLEAAEKDDHLAVELVSSWGHGAAGHFGGARAPGLWLMMGGERLLERAAPGVLYRDLAACNAYADAPARAAAVSCPVRLVLGDGDNMTPAKAGRKLAEAFNGAEAIVIPDCGHMMMTERPDQTLDALKGFL
ncbi:MAG: alpha/beta hydrolase [Rhodovibrionaceae bacterium]|nr:alpha/beta hydrolase [Rhodovibrionaceae bacterium]